MEKEYHLNGTKISTESGFYRELSRILLIEKSTIKQWNLDVLDDVLEGGFSPENIENGMVLKWKNFRRSKSKLSSSFLAEILEILDAKENIELVLE